MELLKLKIKSKIIEWNNTPFEEKIETLLMLIVLLLITIYLTLISSPLRVSAQIMPMAITDEEEAIETTQVNFSEEQTEEVTEEAVEGSEEAIETTQVNFPEEQTEEVIEEAVEGSEEAIETTQVNFPEEQTEEVTEEAVEGSEENIDTYIIIVPEENVVSLAVKYNMYIEEGPSIEELVNYYCASGTTEELFAYADSILPDYFDTYDYMILNEARLGCSRGDELQDGEVYTLYIKSYTLKSEGNTEDSTESTEDNTQDDIQEGVTSEEEMELLTELNENIRLVFYVLVIFLFVSLVGKNFFV